MASWFGSSRAGPIGLWETQKFWLCNTKGRKHHFVQTQCPVAGSQGKSRAAAWRLDPKPSQHLLGGAAGSSDCWDGMGRDGMDALWGQHGAAGILSPPQLPCFRSQAVLTAPSPPGPCLSCKPLIRAATCCSHPPALSLHPLSPALFLLCYPGLFVPRRLRAAGSC